MLTWAENEQATLFGLVLVEPLNGSPEPPAMAPSPPPQSILFLCTYMVEKEEEEKREKKGETIDHIVYEMIPQLRTCMLGHLTQLDSSSPTIWCVCICVCVCVSK